MDGDTYAPSSGDFLWWTVEVDLNAVDWLMSLRSSPSGILTPVAKDNLLLKTKNIVRGGMPQGRFKSGLHQVMHRG